MFKIILISVRPNFIEYGCPRIRSEALLEKTEPWFAFIGIEVGYKGIEGLDMGRPLYLRTGTVKP